MIRNEGLNVRKNGEYQMVQDIMSEFEFIVWEMSCRTFSIVLRDPDDETLAFSWCYCPSPERSAQTDEREFRRQVIDTQEQYLDSIRAYLFSLLVIVAIG